MEITDLWYKGYISDLALSLRLLLPEVIVCLTVLVLLYARMRGATGRLIGTSMLLGSTIALAVQLWLTVENIGLIHEVGMYPLFTGLLIYDGVSIFARTLLLLFLVFFTWLTLLSRLGERTILAEFYVLVLGAVVGMCLMVSAGHVLTVFLGIEMASVPGYAMAGMLRGRKTAAEAALKFAVYGAASAGALLFGLSLLCGLTGSTFLADIGGRLQLLLQSGDRIAISVAALAAILITAGLAYKISAVPFHFWLPDVFEGSMAEVAALLAVASKAAAAVLILRVALWLPGGLPQAETAVRPGANGTSALVVSTTIETAERNTASSAKSDGGFAQGADPVRRFVVTLLIALSAITATFGNLAAYAQSNIKRLLAYSTIAHAGYILMPVAGIVYAVSTLPEIAQAACAGVLFYLVVYLFMNLGAFAAVAFLWNATRSEAIDDYAGLVNESPGFVVAVAVLLFSLLGIPPLGGFVAKFVAFAPLVGTGSRQLLMLVLIGVLNTVLSLFYYVRVVKVMVFDRPGEGTKREAIRMQSGPGIYMALMALVVLGLGVFYGPAYEWAFAAAGSFLGLYGSAL